MTKKLAPDELEFAAQFNEARTRIVNVVGACAETLPFSSIMAALGEALVETTDALMTTEQEMKGTTATTLLAARDLLHVIARQIQMRAVSLAMDPDANNQVH